MCTSKEIAKFIAGFMFNGLLGHIWLASHKELLPMKFWGINVTPALNNFGIGFHIVITLLLIYYAWFWKRNPNKSS